MPENHDPSYTLTPGQLLRAARETRSFTQSDIARQTRLSIQAVHDIEQDAYAQLGVRTFVRGYLCAYARIVGIPENQILEALNASGLMPDASTAQPAITEGAPVTNVTRQYIRFQPSRRWIVIGVSGVILIVVVALLLSKRAPSDLKLLTKKTVSPPAVVAVARENSLTDTSTAKPAHTAFIATADITPTAPSFSTTLSATSSETTALSDTSQHDDAKTLVKSHLTPTRHSVKQKNDSVIQPSKLAQSHTTYTISPVHSGDSSNQAA